LVVHVEDLVDEMTRVSKEFRNIRFLFPDGSGYIDESTVAQSQPQEFKRSEIGRGDGFMLPVCLCAQRLQIVALSLDFLLVKEGCVARVAACAAILQCAGVAKEVGRFRIVLRKGRLARCGVTKEGDGLVD
jgi:hypothetical protein